MHPLALVCAQQDEAARTSAVVRVILDNLAIPRLPTEIFDLFKDTLGSSLDHSIVRPADHEIKHSVDLLNSRFYEVPFPSSSVILERGAPDNSNCVCEISYDWKEPDYCRKAGFHVLITLIFYHELISTLMQLLRPLGRE